MAAKKKKLDPIKQREKRVKIAAIVGTVMFLAVAAYEVPSMLAVMNKKPPPGSTIDNGPSSVLPNISGGTTAPAAPTGQLVNTDVPPSSAEGQLVSFSVFQTKNPFTPQVSNAPPTSDSGATTATPSTANKQGADVPTGATTTPATMTTTPTTTTPVGSVVPPSAPAPSTTTPTTTTPTTTTTTPVAPTVAISVNGSVSRVATQGTFPTGAPVFRLVSWSKGVAQIGIVGGSYATGDATIALRLGIAVTLENQTDGKQYKIELLSTP